MNAEEDVEDSAGRNATSTTEGEDPTGEDWLEWTHGSSVVYSSTGKAHAPQPRVGLRSSYLGGFSLSME